MKIAISGASGTGKTTLARALAEHYKIPLNPVGSRDVAKAMGFDNPYDVDKAGLRVEFQNKLFEAKLEWETRHAHFVTDRSYFDNLSYCALHMAEHVTDTMTREFMVAMKLYDAVLMLPAWNFQQLDDGIRQTNRCYHHFYESVLGGLYDLELETSKSWGITVFRKMITSTDRENRFIDATDYIGLIPHLEIP